MSSPVKNKILIDANTKSELDASIQDLDSIAPQRTDSNKEGREQWLVHKLLQALQERGCVEAPLRLCKRESPDFLLETMTNENIEFASGNLGSQQGGGHGSLTIGIEVTEAVVQDYAKVMASPEVNELGVLVSPREFYVGDMAEKEFAALIDRAVCRKQRKLSGNYDKFDRNWLLVKFRGLAPAGISDKDIKRALELTSGRLSKYWGEGTMFDAVFVLLGNHLLLFNKMTGEKFHDVQFLEEDRPWWQQLVPEEKLYIKGLELELNYEIHVGFKNPYTGKKREDSKESATSDTIGSDYFQRFQELASELGVTDYGVLLQPGLRGQVRMRTPSEFRDGEWQVSSFGRGLVGRTLYAVWKVAETEDVWKGREWLKNNVPDYQNHKDTIWVILLNLASMYCPFTQIERWRRDVIAANLIRNSIASVRMAHFQEGKPLTWEA